MLAPSSQKSFQVCSFDSHYEGLFVILLLFSVGHFISSSHYFDLQHITSLSYIYKKFRLDRIK